jgi:HEPN domain-containing protein
MDRPEELRQWFALGLQDLTIAEHAATTMHPTPDERICNLCQAAAERYLKGFLFLNHVEPPKIHDVFALGTMCEKLVPEFSTLMPKTQFLTQYGTLPRYPNELQITDDDMRVALRFAKDVQAFVLAACAPFQP